MTTIETTAPIDMFGFDFDAEIEVSITSFGERNTFSRTAISPPDDPEWTITGMSLRVDEPGYLGPWWHIDPSHKLFDVLERHPRIEGAAADAVMVERSSRYWNRRRRRVF